MKFLKNILVTLALIATIHLSGMHPTWQGQSASTITPPTTSTAPNLTLTTTTPQESPYSQWLKNDADVSELSPEKYFKLIAETFIYNEEQALEMFKKLVSSLRNEDYEKVFTSKVIYNSIQNTFASDKIMMSFLRYQKHVADNQKKFEYLIHKLVNNKDSVVIQRIQDELSKIETGLKQKIEFGRYTNMPKIALLEERLKNFSRTRDVINQTLQQEAKEQEKRAKMFMTRTKGDTGFAFIKK